VTSIGFRIEVCDIGQKLVAPLADLRAQNIDRRSEAEFRKRIAPRERMGFVAIYEGAVDIKKESADRSHSEGDTMQSS
jgi:hypothetical protein